MILFESKQSQSSRISIDLGIMILQTKQFTIVQDKILWIAEKRGEKYLISQQADQAKVFILWTRKEKRRFS